MPHPRRMIPPVRESDRRRYERRPASEFPDVSARLLGGAQVRLIDLSTRGVLLETSVRLLPGATVVVRFIAPDTEMTLRGCVVRSSVGHLSSDGLRYHTALNFAEDLTILDSAPKTDHSPSHAHLRIVSRDEKDVPDGAASTGDKGGTSVARQHTANDADGEASALPPLELVAMVSQTGPELLDLLAANDW